MAAPNLAGAPGGQRPIRPGTRDEPDFSGLGGGEDQQADDIVREVVGWYNAQIIGERRAPVPDDERIEKLSLFFKVGPGQ
ncbi:hypothetical protein ACWKT5_25125 [Streptomyces avermitilis]